MTTSTAHQKKAASRPSIPTPVTIRLWVAAGGRCQFDGCNTPLWKNDLTMEELNLANRAHIYAYSPDGPRYHTVLSPKLETDFNNLMLVCGKCHPTFDNSSLVEHYTPELLMSMKRSHEERIELVTGIAPEKRSQVLLFGAKVGEHERTMRFMEAANAMFPERYPSGQAIELGLRNTSFRDRDRAFWDVEPEHLERQFAEKVAAFKSGDQVQHYSLFGFAPIPLLMKLGVLLGDVYPADVFQLRREPTSWKWDAAGDDVRHEIRPPSRATGKVALKLELSAPISDQRVIDVLGEDCSIWSVTHPNPGNDYIRKRSHLEDVRTVFRTVMRQVKALSPEPQEIHVFPAMPLSTAVEFGRVRMPKADPNLIVYDENKGFHYALTIERK